MASDLSEEIAVGSDVKAFNRVHDLGNANYNCLCEYQFANCQVRSRRRLPIDGVTAVAGRSFRATTFPCSRGLQTVSRPRPVRLLSAIWRSQISGRFARFSITSDNHFSRWRSRRYPALKRYRLRGKGARERYDTKKHRRFWVGSPLCTVCGCRCYSADDVDE